MTTATTEDIHALKGQINVLAHWVLEVARYLDVAKDDENFQGAMTDEEYRSLVNLTECGKCLSTDVLFPGVAKTKAFYLNADRNPYRWMRWEAIGTLPDSDTTVFVTLDPAVHGEPVWMAYHDGSGWMSIDGSDLPGVLGWAHLPEGITQHTGPVCNINRPWEAPTERG